MDYWKIKQSLREILEQNGGKISDRAEARLIKMSQKGYTAMMNKHTMTVKKLEEVASLTKKPVSYFFTEDEKNNKQKVSKSKITTYGCPDCIKKQKEIDQLQKEKDAIKDKYIECLEQLSSNKGGDRIANSA